MRTKNQECFYEITSNDIMKKLEEIEGKLNSRDAKIKLNTWLGSVSIALYLGVLSLIMLK